MRNKALIIAFVVLLAACQQHPNEGPCRSCGNALIAYAEQYPAAEPTDLYKLVFQDMYGPGHLLTDSTAALRYINAELDGMDSVSGMPIYE